MTFDPAYGHFQGAGGSARGFHPPQGPGGAEPSPYLTDLESWWKFDTASGAFTDSVTATAMTQVNTPASMTGVINQAAVVSYSDASRGTTTAAALLSAAEVSGGAGGEGTYTAHPFTACCWVYPENVGTNYPFYLYERQTTGHAAGINWYMGTYAGSDANDVQFDWGVSGSGSLKYVSTAKTYAKDEWHFVCIRYFGCGYDSGASPPGDATDRRFVGNYVNEKQIMVVSGGAGSGTLSTIAYKQDDREALQDGTVFSIGDSVAGKSAGGIDLLGIWRDRLLTNAEILALYELTIGGTDHPFS